MNATPRAVAPPFSDRVNREFEKKVRQLYIFAPSLFYNLFYRLKNIK